MTNEEDEAFDELARKQGDWGGGFPAKRKMAADKLQEPVAWMYQCTADNSGPVLLRHRTNWAESNSGLWTETPLYTAPPQREWVGLTEEDFSAINQSCLTKLQAATSSESILKEKNNG